VREGAPQVPGYEILGELGRGGMGVVFRARQLGLHRLCALKMILAGGHAAEEELTRFRREAEAIARLQHGNIVAVYDIGTHDGKPFFSLELCAGGSLDRKLNGTPLQPLEAAKLVKTLAEAMQAAHEAKVIHRDLKPANVLLAADGTPKITDFGLARKLDEPGQTRTGAILGTPSYMAPEQAEGKKDIGPLADVYALGAILYDCLTGRPPFKAATSFDTILQVVSAEPVPPTQLNAKVPCDLETICLKCLHKQPAHRYPSAVELAEDLRRFQAGEAIRARPVGRLERVARWCRRRPAVAALMAVSVLAGLGLLGGGAFFTALLAERNARLANEVSRAEKAERDALDLAKKEEQARWQADREKRVAQFQTLHAETARQAILTDLALRAWQQHDLTEAEHLLSKVAGPFRQNWETRHLRDLCRRTATPLWEHAGSISGVAISADGNHIVAARRTGTQVPGAVRVWDVGMKQQTWTIQNPRGEVWGVAISGDGKRIVLCGGKFSQPGVVAVWDRQTKQQTRTLEGHRDTVFSVAINGDGKRIASGCRDGTVKVWDAETGQARLSIKAGTSPVTSVAISREGKHVVAPADDGALKVWDAEMGRLERTLKGHEDTVSSVAISADGKRIVSGEGKFASSRPGVVKVWNAETGQLTLTLTGHLSPVTSVAISDDGTRVLSGSANREMKVWDARSGQLESTRRAHTATIQSVALSGDGKRIVSGCGSGTVKLWDSGTTQERFTLTGHSAAVNSVAISRDGRTVVSGGGELLKRGSCELKVWSTRTGLQKWARGGHTFALLGVAISHDGKWIISGSMDGAVKVWDTETGQEQLTLKGHTNVVNSVAISRDGKRIVSGSWDKTVKVWDTRMGKHELTLQGHTYSVRSVAISPDGKRIISGGDLTVKVWDARTGKLERTLEGHRSPVSSVAISADGAWIVSGCQDLTVRVWDAQTGKLERVLEGHTGADVTSVAISHDGKRIVSGGAELGKPGEVKVWDAQTGQAMLSLRGHAGPVSSVAISRDGNRIISASVDRTVKVWEAPP
jgi:WD40 repeat protein